MAKILIIHGPNLNMLGMREPDIYGTESLVSINKSLAEFGCEHAHAVTAFQSNSESSIVDQIHASITNFDFLIINPAGLSHTSVVLRDAL